MLRNADTGREHTSCGICMRALFCSNGAVCAYERRWRHYRDVLMPFFLDHAELSARCAAAVAALMAGVAGIQHALGAALVSAPLRALCAVCLRGRLRAGACTLWFRVRCFVGAESLPMDGCCGRIRLCYRDRQIQRKSGYVLCFADVFERVAAYSVAELSERPYVSIASGWKEHASGSYSSLHRPSAFPCHVLEAIAAAAPGVLAAAFTLSPPGAQQYVDHTQQSCRCRDSGIPTNSLREGAGYSVMGAGMPNVR
jgi:hypothetical protein